MKKYLRLTTATSILAAFGTLGTASAGGLPSQWVDNFATSPTNVQILSTADQEAYKGAAGPAVLAGIGGAAGAATYLGSTLISGNSPTLSGLLLAAAGGAAAGMAPGLGLGPAGTAVVQGGIGVGTSAAVSVTDRTVNRPPLLPHQILGIGRR